jgi:hypothetical protein
MCQPTWRQMVWERYIGDALRGKCYTIRCTAVITPFQFDLAYDDNTEPIRSRIGGTITPPSIDFVKPTCTMCAQLSKEHGSFTWWNEWSQRQRTRVQSEPYVPCNKESTWRCAYGEVLFAPCLYCTENCSVFSYSEYGTVTCDVCRTTEPRSSDACHPFGIVIKRFAHLRSKIAQCPSGRAPTT